MIPDVTLACTGGTVGTSNKGNFGITAGAITLNGTATVHGATMSSAMTFTLRIQLMLHFLHLHVLNTIICAQQPVVRLPCAQEYC